MEALKSMLRLDNKVCVITGCGEGIGAAIARGFAARGAVVIATSLSEPHIPEAGACMAWDVTSAERAEEVMQEILTRFGRIDAFIANAGLMPRMAWEEITKQDWREVLSANLDGAWFGAQAAAKHMVRQGYGKIVFVSSIEVELGVNQHCHYVSSKAGIIGLTRSLARSVGPDGVRVNCVMPGAVQTETELRQFPDQAALAQWCDERQCIPGRLQPADIEPVFAFLCSAESDAITSQVLCADGGLVHY